MSYMISSGFDPGDSNIFAHDCYPRRCPILKGCRNTIRVKTFGIELYKNFMHRHVPKCLEMGGEVIVVFGQQAKMMFAELLWENGYVGPDCEVTVEHQGQTFGVQIVTYSNSLISKRPHRNYRLSGPISPLGPTTVRHLVIYAPHPAAFIVRGKKDDPRRKKELGLELDAKLDYACGIVGREYRDKSFFCKLAQDNFFER
jgi:hypothetical protein